MEIPHFRDGEEDQLELYRIQGPGVSRFGEGRVDRLHPMYPVATMKFGGL